MKVATMHDEKTSTPTPTAGKTNPIELSESEYLAREVAEAKSELENALAGLKSGVASSADLRAWVKRYPWAALGTAVVAGFAAGTAVAPARNESLQEKISRLATNGQVEATEPRAKPTAPEPATRSLIFDKLLTSLFDLAKFAIQSVILATLRPPTANQDPETASPDAWRTRVAK
jgi:hypothetical protein